MFLFILTHRWSNVFFGALPHFFSLCVCMCLWGVMFPHPSLHTFRLHILNLLCKHGHMPVKLTCTKYISLKTRSYKEEKLVTIIILHYNHFARLASGLHQYFIAIYFTEYVLHCQHLPFALDKTSYSPYYIITIFTESTCIQV